jgi:hypothetical protein
LEENKDFDICEELRLLAVGFLCRGETRGSFESGVLMIGFSDSFPIVPFFEVVYALFEYLLEKKDFDVWKR